MRPSSPFTFCFCQQVFISYLLIECNFIKGILGVRRRQESCSKEQHSTLKEITSEIKTALFITYRFIELHIHAGMSINPFLANVPTLYPLKTPENPRFSSVFTDYKMGTLARSMLIMNGMNIVSSNSKRCTLDNAKLHDVFFARTVHSF